MCYPGPGAATQDVDIFDGNYDMEHQSKVVTAVFYSGHRNSISVKFILAPRRVKGETTPSIPDDSLGILVYQTWIFALWLTYGGLGINQSVTVIPS